MKSSSRSGRRMVAVSLLCLVLPQIASAGEKLRRPDGWKDLPRKQRPNVSLVDLEYVPAPSPQQPFAGLRFCLLPILNSTDIDRHLAAPPESFDKETVLTRLGADQRARVIALSTSAKTGRPLSGLLTEKPFERILFDSLTREMEAVGIEVMPPPVTTPPESIDNDVLLALAAQRPEEEAPDYLLAVEIVDLYLNHYMDGMIDIGVKVPQYWVNLSFELSLKLVELEAGEVRWEGPAKAVRERESFQGSWVKMLRHDFQYLVEEVLRTNEELQAALRSSLPGPAG